MCGHRGRAGTSEAAVRGGVSSDGTRADLYMREVNIRSGKQPWVSHQHRDSKAFNRNTHSRSLINKARFSVCADLSSAFLSLGKPAVLAGRRQAVWAMGLGCVLSDFGCWPSASALQRATFSSPLGLGTNGMGGHSHPCPDEEHEAQRCKLTCPRSCTRCGLSRDVSLVFFRTLSLSIPFSVNCTSVLQLRIPETSSSAPPFLFLPSPPFHCLLEPGLLLVSASSAFLFRPSCSGKSPREGTRQSWDWGCGFSPCQLRGFPQVPS